MNGDHNNKNVIVEFIECNFDQSISEKIKRNIHQDQRELKYLIKHVENFSELQKSDLLKSFMEKIYKIKTDKEIEWFLILTNILFPYVKENIEFIKKLSLFCIKKITKNRVHLIRKDILSSIIKTEGMLYPYFKEKEYEEANKLFESMFSILLNSNCDTEIRRVALVNLGLHFTLFDYDFEWRKILKLIKLYEQYIEKRNKLTDSELSIIKPLFEDFYAREGIFHLKKLYEGQIIRKSMEEGKK